MSYRAEGIALFQCYIEQSLSHGSTIKIVGFFLLFLLCCGDVVPSSGDSHITVK